MPSGSALTWSSGGGDEVPGLRERRPQDRLDLVELLRVCDQRRRELHDGVTAVVRAADQALAVELARQEPAQQPLGLLVREGFLGLAVLDELDRVEEPRAAHVAHDR